MLQTIQNAIIELAKSKQNLAVNVHLTGKCDMKCIGCYARFGEDVKSKPFSLTQSNWVQVIDNIYKYTSGLNVKINFVGGEPLLYPHLPYLLEHTKSRGFTTSIVTNGSLLKRRFAELKSAMRVRHD